MPDALAERISRRHDALKGLRQGHWDDKWQQIADEAIGRREFTNKGDPGRKRTQQIYDTTTRTMVNLLAGGLHSLLTNPATQWFALRTLDDNLMNSHSTQVWLESVNQYLLSIFQRPASRFASQSDECYLDVVSFGTAGMFVADPPGRPVLFSQRPLPELYIAENEAGVIDTVYREFELTARNAVNIWGRQAPEAARKHVEGGQTEKKVHIVHAVEPAEGETLKGFNVTPMPYTSVFIERDARETIGQPSGFFEMPYILWRWRVDGGEVYGRGPAEDAFSDQRSLHTMNKTQLQAAQMGVAPPFLTEDTGSILQLDLRPFGRNVVKPGGVLSPPIQSMDIKAQNLLSAEMVRDKRGQVEEAFHFELLKLIQNRGLTPMTARQASMIENAVQRLLAPILGRAHVEWIYPLVDRVYNIELRRGNIPPPPPELSDAPLKIEALSPITRAQRAGDVDAVARWLGSVAEYAQIDPSVRDLADTDEAFRFMAKHSSVPPSVVRDPRVVARMRAADAELAAQQDAQDAAEQTARSLGQAAPFLQALQQ